MKESKINKNSNLNLAKDMFFECQGSMMHLDREFPQYRSFNVSLHIEREWKEEIISTLLTDIQEQTGIEKTNSLNKLSNIYDSELMVQLLYDHLDMDKLDGFSKIICLEILKKVMNTLNITHKYKKSQNLDSTDVIKSIKNKINQYKDSLLNQELTIDATYQNAYVLKYYDFSQENLNKRIERI